MKCSVCGERYDMGNTRILVHENNLWLIRAVCSSCQAQYLIAAGVKGYQAAEAVTDLTQAESDKFIYFNTLSADEVLDMHNFLKTFDGDFVHFFQVDPSHEVGIFKSMRCRKAIDCCIIIIDIKKTLRIIIQFIF